jgi:hypothetical protein
MCAASDRTACDTLSKQKELVEIADATEDLAHRDDAILQLLDSNPVLMRWTGSTHFVAGNSREAIARIKLATQEAPVKARVPGLQCTGDVQAKRRHYNRDPIMHSPIDVEGETVTIKLLQNGRALAEGSWSSSFPETLSVPRGTNDVFRAADISVEELLIKLFHLAVFTPEDLATLARSEIPEVRSSAAANLTDQTLLRKMATEETEPTVRRAAIEKLTDQAVLVKLAKTDQDPAVRKAAGDRLLAAQPAKSTAATEDPLIRALRRVYDEHATNFYAIATKQLGDATPQDHKISRPSSVSLSGSRPCTIEFQIQDFHVPNSPGPEASPAHYNCSFRLGSDSKTAYVFYDRLQSAITTATSLICGPDDVTGIVRSVIGDGAILGQLICHLPDQPNPIHTRDPYIELLFKRGIPDRNIYTIDFDLQTQRWAKVPSY